MLFLYSRTPTPCLLRFMVFCTIKILLPIWVVEQPHLEYFSWLKIANMKKDKYCVTMYVIKLDNILFLNLYFALETCVVVCFFIVLCL